MAGGSRSNRASYQGVFPFRIGSTSYVIPDDLLPNVVYMAGVVDDIEVVLFESPDVSNLPTGAAIEILGNSSQRTSTSYTIHFPIDRKACSHDARERGEFGAQAVRIMELFEPIAPYGYVVHLEGLARGHSAEDARGWRTRAREACRALCDGPVEPERLCIENLGYDPLLNVEVAAEFGMSLCLDAGHLWLYERAWETLAPRLLERARIMHLHGVNIAGKDHVSLGATDQSRLNALLGMMRGVYTGVVTLEVFNESDTFESLEVLDRLWHA